MIYSNKIIYIIEYDINNSTKHLNLYFVTYCHIKAFRYHEIVLFNIKVYKNLNQSMYFPINIYVICYQRYSYFKHNTLENYGTNNVIEDMVYSSLFC